MSFIKFEIESSETLYHLLGTVLQTALMAIVKREEGSGTGNSISITNVWILLTSKMVAFNIGNVNVRRPHHHRAQQQQPTTIAN